MQPRTLAFAEAPAIPGVLAKAGRVRQLLECITCGPPGPPQVEPMLNSTRILLSAACTLLVLGSAANAQTPAAGTQTQTVGAGNQVTVPFSDPSRPGTVKVNVVTGGISVRV